MDTCFAALLLLLSATASCAPAGRAQQDAFADVRNSSLQLNRVAKRVSIEARNGSRYFNDFPWILRMEVKDVCDPKALKQTSVPCIQNMLDVLASYNSTVTRVARFQICSKFAEEVMPEIQKLHKDLSKCVTSSAGAAPRKPRSNDEDQVVHHYEEDLLCYYTLDRLFSFSILTARVFAHGDPASHADGAAQKCM